jgi:hypothetical protein
MSRLALCLVLGLSSFSLAQEPSQTSVSPQQAYSGSSAVQVVYVVNGSTLTTYNINPHTLQATQVGTLTVPQSPFACIIASSPDDRFLYYSGGQGTIYVYATNELGVPQSPPVRQLSANSLASGPVFDPSAPFAYDVIESTQDSDETTYFLERLSFDAATGTLSHPEIEGKYELPTAGQLGQTCWPGIMGFNPGSSELYDEIDCSSQVGPFAKYNQRTVNTQTGALGPDVYIAGWYTGHFYVENLQFVNNLMFAFEEEYQAPPSQNFVDIYPAQPDVKTPVAQCTGAQMQACADFSVGVAHPSGQYVFLLDSNNVTEVGEVDLSAQDIYGPVSSIPYQVQQFSPDGSIAYGINEVGNVLELEIYGFSVSTGAVTQGGTISVPVDYDPWWVAERD